MAERAGNTVVNARLGKGQACGRRGLAQAEGTALVEVGSCVPKAGMGLCTTGIRIALRREEVTRLQTLGRSRNVGLAGLQGA